MVEDRREWNMYIVEKMRMFSNRYNMSTYAGRTVTAQNYMHTNIFNMKKKTDYKYTYSEEWRAKKLNSSKRRGSLIDYTTEYRQLNVCPIGRHRQP